MSAYIEARNAGRHLEVSDLTHTEGVIDLVIITPLGSGQHDLGVYVDADALAFALNDIIPGFKASYDGPGTLEDQVFNEMEPTE